MKCERCGATLPENSIQCRYCGHTLQMVPDYNPLGDVIEEEVRSAIHVDSRESSMEDRQYTRNMRTVTQTGRLQERNTERMRNHGRMDERNHPNPKNYPDRKQTNRASNQEKTTRESRELEKRKRREAEKRRALKRKRRNLVLGIMAGILLIFIISIYLAYSNSYSGLMNKGDKALANNELFTAIEYYEKAIKKDDDKSEAYIAIADVYRSNDNIEDAESVLLEAISLNPDNIELNQALINLYVENDEMDKVNDYVSNLTNAKIIKELENYQSSIPVFSLVSGDYEDVQELTISSEEGTIYYTLDGTEASTDGEVYSAPIQIGEGTTTVRAISVNTEGVPSYECVSVYTVELPMESAPVVSPTTGQYSEEMQITVTVPSGYTAYYTLDNTTPTTDSTMYTGPIDMPEGNTIFTAILVNASGKTSDVTKRNYDLILAAEEED